MLHFVLRNQAAVSFSDHVLNYIKESLFQVLSCQRLKTGVAKTNSIWGCTSVGLKLHCASRSIQTQIGFGKCALGKDVGIYAIV